MSEEKIAPKEMPVVVDEVGNAYRPLLTYHGTYYVPVSHTELSGLIGRLMQLCELNGNREQRDALKWEIKLRSREWLDDLYQLSAYTNHKLDDGAEIVNILTGKRETHVSPYRIVHTKN